MARTSNLRSPLFSLRNATEVADVEAALDFADDFGRIIDYFVSEYNRGRTPNPCVRCNDWLKFGELVE